MWSDLFFLWTLCTVIATYITTSDNQTHKNMIWQSFLEFSVCLDMAGGDQKVPHLQETVTKAVGHGEAVCVWTAVPGTDRYHNFLLSRIVADAIAIFNHCPKAEENAIVGCWYLST